MFNDGNPQDLIDQLHIDLLVARKARDQLTTTTLQTILSAIDNAGAVPVPENINVIGTGSTEAPRRVLSMRDIRKLIQYEIIEIQDAVKELSDTEISYVGELNNRIAILENYL